VFGRHEDFDPHLDSLVRVQAARLRAKLVEYYDSEGSGDAVVVKLPKGTYALTFHERTPVAAATHHVKEAVVSPEVRESVPQRVSNYGWIIALVAFAMLLSAALAVAIDRLLWRPGVDSKVAADTDTAPAPIRT
jgi:hypothetical protein